MKRFILIAFVVAALVVCYFIFPARRPMDADKIAAAETQMWRAYYGGDLPGLQRELVAALRAQFGLSAGDAAEVGKSLAMAAMKFEISTGDYETAALPDLEVAYRKLGQILKRPFDPRKAAQGELAWWITRRSKVIDPTPLVGKQIAALYAVIYGSDRPEFAEAGRLRAEAAALRDKGGANADWAKIESILQKSYRTLATGAK